MKTKKVILRRMTVLYVVFFVVIALGIVRSFAESGDTVHVGFNDGWNNTMTAPDSDNVGFIYELRTVRGTAYDIPVCGGGTDSVMVCARPALLDIKVEMPDGEQTTGMSSNTYAGLYVVLAALLYTRRQSFQTVELERNGEELKKLLAEKENRAAGKGIR